MTATLCACTSQATTARSSSQPARKCLRRVKLCTRAGGGTSSRQEDGPTMKALCARARARRAPHAWAGTAGDARPTPGLRLARMRGGRARAAQPGSAARARLAAGAPRGRSRRRPRRPRPAFPAAPALPALRPWPRAPPRQGLGLGNHKPPRADTLISRACVLGESRERRAQRVQSAAGAYTTWPPCARGMRQPCRPPARQRRAGPGARWRRGSLPKCNMACARACREVPKQAPPTGQGVTLDPVREGRAPVLAQLVDAAAQPAGRRAQRAQRHLLAHVRRVDGDCVLHLPQRGRWRQREGVGRVCGLRAAPRSGSCAPHEQGPCPAPAAARSLASA